MQELDILLKELKSKEFIELLESLEGVKKESFKESVHRMLKSEKSPMQQYLNQ
ncbi:hypothetical protein [Helicobacter cetorum]|uniref:hypothetical protein n=1 Tax=Helicobacter cetorum TaxID=138563 RepID=UPI0002D2A878|nr:hypothetical protein [Helicobacter cetorum]